MVSIDTVIPKAHIFRFENFWVQQPGFYDCVKEVWSRTTKSQHSSGILTEKLKALRKALKIWGKSLSKLRLLIAKCNTVILFFDTLEEERQLFVQEANFRKAVKFHLECLMRAQFLYWKKRCTMRWIKLGEENSKFFHAMATERFRRNSMASITLADGTVISDHEQMAAVAWNCYKQRMGTTNAIDMQYDLDVLIPAVEGLESLADPFTTDDIDSVIKSMPLDRAPGPHGFNGMFMRKCWDIVKHDFYNLAQDFHSGNVQLENINTSFITLVPKKSSPEQMSDYRPISLTNCCLKFITKLLADRLQSKIENCIHRNQYGFIKGRTIQDRLAWSFEYIHQCHSSKKPIVILKLDFEKAFDSVEFQAIYLIMSRMGFPESYIT